VDAWPANDVVERSVGTKRYRHPVVGDLTIHYEALRMPDDQDQLLLVYTTEPGSRSSEAMALLDSWGSPADEAVAAAEARRTRPDAAPPSRHGTDAPVSGD
jgi:isochorismate hydrolase